MDVQTSRTGTAPQPVRIGIVGMGKFGRLHAATVAGVAEAELVALVDREESTLAAAAGDFPSIPTGTDLAKVLESSEAEAWIVASSTASHVPLARMILEAGKAVLLEKPIAEDLASAESLGKLDAAESRNLMMGHVALFNTEFRALNKEAAGRGSIRFIDCVRHRPVSTAAAFPGEDPFHLTMVHDLYLVAALMGQAEPTSMHARAARNGQGACDLALAELAWADGTLARLTASFQTPEGMGADGFDRMEVFGTGWAARICPNPRPLEVWDGRAQHPLTLEIAGGAGAPTGMLAEQLRCFCRVVRGTEPVPAGSRYEDALRVQRWLKRLSEAAAS